MKKKIRKSKSSSQAKTSGDRNDQPDASDDEDDEVDIDQCIRVLVKDKARNNVIRQQLQDVLNGVDKQTVSKCTYGNWLTTLMPRIHDDIFAVVVAESWALVVVASHSAAGVEQAAAAAFHNHQHSAAADQTEVVAFDVASDLPFAVVAVGHP